jgi:hypothetical protein
MIRTRQGETWTDTRVSREINLAYIEWLLGVIRQRRLLKGGKR